jgi:hypothetical protein
MPGLEGRTPQLSLHLEKEKLLVRLYISVTQRYGSISYRGFFLTCRDIRVFETT